MKEHNDKGWYLLLIYIFNIYTADTKPSLEKNYI